jgi:hypothetical protein
MCLRYLPALVLFFARFLASSLASKSGFDTLFLAGLQVKGVALDLLDYVFLLHLALEAAQSVLEGFTLLKSYFCQTDTPPNPSGWTEQLLQGIGRKSREREEICWISDGGVGMDHFATFHWSSLGGSSRSLHFEMTGFWESQI